jgi:hypothetical protein
MLIVLSDRFFNDIKSVLSTFDYMVDSLHEWGMEDTTP